MTMRVTLYCKSINMKTLIVLLVLTLQWGTDFEAAQKTARDNNKLILLYFSGSDWCAPCIKTKRDYFANERFETLASSHLVLVNADFPRLKKNRLPAAQMAKNEALAERFNKDGIFPLTILTDANGKVMESWQGKPQQAPNDWLSNLELLCNQHKK